MATTPKSGDTTVVETGGGSGAGMMIGIALLVGGNRDNPAGQVADAAGSAAGAAVGAVNPSR